MQTVLSKAEEIRNSGLRAAICIVIETRGSTPRKQGSKMIVFKDGTIFGSIGGGPVEKEVAEKTVELIALFDPRERIFDDPAFAGLYQVEYILGSLFNFFQSDNLNLQVNLLFQDRRYIRFPFELYILSLFASSRVNASPASV